MAETFDRASAALTTTTITDLYQCPTSNAANRTIVLSCLVANVDGNNNASITLTITDSANTLISRLANVIIVPAAASLEVVANKVVLKQGEKLRATAGAANRLEVTVSVLEVTL